MVFLMLQKWQFVTELKKKKKLITLHIQPDRKSDSSANNMLLLFILMKYFSLYCDILPWQVFPCYPDWGFFRAFSSVVGQMPG
jgi:hypothetical protein